jgi:tRNA isopentenyl-2-thiomethyl-A-37 hydroxylase MiaE
MQQIKFVLWERYRAWWGAHQLNEKNPILVDHLKDEEKADKLGMTIRQYRQRRAIVEKTAKKNKETARKNKERAALREIRRTAAETLAKEKAARKVEEEAAWKVEERLAQLERNTKEKEERKDAAIMDL